jgi:hypothetical protein
MGKRDYYDKGNYNVICHRCGQKFKATEWKEEWNGLHVCYYCWEARQPQDFVKGLTDDQSVPVASPRGELKFVDD